jgi:hypothetical protein
MSNQFQLTEAAHPSSNGPRNAALFAMIVAAGLCRWIPHPINFTPIGAMALFGGACYAQRRLAFLLPLAALAVGDLATGFHILMPVVYVSFAANVLLGRWLRTRRTFLRTAAFTFAGAVQFFIVTNLATWWVYYPHSIDGLAACFVAAIPCFQNTLAGDAVFTGLLFGALAVIEHQLPALRESALQPVAA